MKKLSPYRYFVLAAISVLALSSCHIEDPAANVAVNPKYEMNPPIADSVYVQRLQNDNEHVLIIAKFPKEKLEEKYLAIYNGDDKIVLRDDGKESDLKEGDRLYTAKIKTSPDEVGNLLKPQDKIVSDDKNHLITFGPRGMVVSEFANQPILYEDFNRFRPTVITPNFPPVTEALKNHSLMITALPVVEDPTRTWNFCTQTGNLNGAWAFGTHMRNLATTDPAHPATDAEVSTFVLNWLNQYRVQQTINTETINADRSVSEMIDTWLQRSATISNGPQLNMSFAPFKLLAIVNRLDLRGNSGFGFSNAGEGRFIFCSILTDPDGMCEPHASYFTLIFEYAINKATAASIGDYAKEWYNLKDKTPGSADYNTALQHITDQFTLSGTHPSRPNQSSLDQLRTSDNSDNGRQMREFHLNASTAPHYLKETTVSNEPAEKFNAKEDNSDVTFFANYINTNQSDILANLHNVPTNLNNIPLLGGKGRIEGNAVGPVSQPGSVHHWDGGPSGTNAYINSDDVRQQFSLNTCTGCHSGETQTIFEHVERAFFGTESRLSGFLTGRSKTGFDLDEDGDDTNGIFRVPDPAGRNSDERLRQFNDLQRRALDLEILANCGNFCLLLRNLSTKPLLVVH